VSAHLSEPAGSSSSVAQPGENSQAWSTEDAPRRAQFAYWRELICEAFLHLTPESDEREGFAGQVVQWPLGELSIASIRSQRQRVRRTSRDIARAPHTGYYANLQVVGSSVMTQASRSTVLRPGDLAIVDTTVPFEFGFRDDFRQLSFYLPQALLDNQLEAAVPTATRVSTATGVGAAVRHALFALAGNQLPGGVANRLATHAGGLLAVALAGPVDQHRVATRHDKVYAAALADIAEHLGDDDLSPPTTALRLAVSVRLLHAVFAGRERTFAAEVRRRRLEVARRDLQDPARAHLRVIDVAVEAGFVNVASFHRAFHREFGRTPAQLRASPAVE
jgi:AraC family transcriptional activator of tynA and feaB